MDSSVSAISASKFSEIDQIFLRKSCKFVKILKNSWKIASQNNVFAQDNFLRMILHIAKRKHCTSIERREVTPDNRRNNFVPSSDTNSIPSVSDVMQFRL